STTTSPPPHDVGTFLGAGRVQNQILVGGPEINVAENNIANDNFKIWARVERVYNLNGFQVGMVFRSNHTTTSDAGVDLIRLYVEDNGSDNVDIVVEKRAAGAAQFTEVVGTVVMPVGNGGSGPEMRFGGIVSGSEVEVFYSVPVAAGQKSGASDETEIVLGTVDLTQGLDPDDFNDSDHQKIGTIMWNNSIVNVIDNLTVDTRTVSPALYFTDAPNTVKWNGKTYSSVSGLSFDPVQETTQFGAQSVRVTVSGVDTSVLTRILQQNYVGQSAIIRHAHIASDGTITSNPVIVFQGLMNAAFEMQETFDPDGGTAKITTRLVSPFAIISKVNGIPAVCQ
ncbi:hypothetical protein LCGC14_3137370, partial [marine sediment metagenome]